QALVDTMAKTSQDGLANLRMVKIDVSRPMSAPFQALWSSQTNATSPWMVVRYPAQTAIELPLWAGPLNAEVFKNLLDSPTRRHLAQALFKGVTAVWLLLESGDKSQDDAIARVVDSESKKLEQTLKLPEPDADDPPMTLELPLKITFS